MELGKRGSCQRPALRLRWTALLRFSLQNKWFLSYFPSQAIKCQAITLPAVVKWLKSRPPGNRCRDLGLKSSAFRMKLPGTGALLGRDPKGPNRNGTSGVTTIIIFPNDRELCQQGARFVGLAGKMTSTSPSPPLPPFRLVHNSMGTLPTKGGLINQSIKVSTSLVQLFLMTLD